MYDLCTSKHVYYSYYEIKFFFHSETLEQKSVSYARLNASFSNTLKISLLWSLNFIKENDIYEFKNL